MKRILAVALIVAVVFAVGEYLSATGSDATNQITSKKAVGIMQYDEADVRLDKDKADTTAWMEMYGYQHCVTCWLVGDIAGDSSHAKVILQVRSRDHAKAIFHMDSVTTAALNGTTYVCEDWTFYYPVKEFRFIRENNVGGAAGDSVWVAEFRTYLGQE